MRAVKLVGVLLGAMIACLLWAAIVTAITPDALWPVSLIVCAVGGWLIGQGAANVLDAVE